MGCCSFIEKGEDILTLLVLKNEAGTEGKVLNIIPLRYERECGRRVR